MRSFSSSTWVARKVAASGPGNTAAPSDSSAAHELARAAVALRCREREHAQLGELAPERARQRARGLAHDRLGAALGAELRDRVGDRLLGVVEREVEAQERRVQRCAVIARRCADAPPSSRRSACEAHAEHVQVVLAREAHRAGELVRLAEQLVGGLGRVGRRGGRRLAGRVARRGFEREPARSLDEHRAHREPVLERLERADRAAELPPPLHVRDGDRRARPTSCRRARPRARRATSCAAPRPSPRRAIRPSARRARAFPPAA